jgi:uncharacterized protein (TIGR02611 family)
MQKTKKRLRKIIIAVLGFTVLIVGILLIVTPGPAILVIPAGLTILASEFPWAEKLLARIKSKLKKTKKATT